MHIHAAENAEQTDNSLARCGRTPSETLRRTGLLDVDLHIAHGTGITEKDVPLLRQGAGRVGVATAPKGYLKFAWGTTPVRALAAGPGFRRVWRRTGPRRTTPSTCGRA